jgi:PAS domain S-box-containing protein
MEQSQQPRTSQTDTGLFSARLSESEGQGLHQQFRVSDDFFRMVLESLEEYAVFTTDTNGTISSWNSGSQRLLGYTEQEIIGAPFALIFTPEDIKNDAPAGEFAQALQTGRGEDERYHVKKDGTLFWASGLLFPLFDRQKKVRGFTKIVRDLTEQKRAQQLIAAARVYAESIVETIREPLLVLDQDLRVVSANRAFYITFHMTSQETEQQVLFALGKGQWNIPALRHLLEGILSSTTVLEDIRVEDEFPVIGRRVLLLNARTLSREANHAELILLAFEDVTERERLQHVKDEFIGIASHELKTPVTSVKGFTQLLLNRFKKQGDEQAVHILSRMDRQLTILTTLINDLLDVTRLQTGKLSQRAAVFNLADLVQETVQDIQAITLTHRLVFAGAENVQVNGDRDRLGQVLINLLTNAIKYSPQAEKVVVHLVTDERLATVRVEDFGIGIAAVHHEKVFEQYYQVTEQVNNTTGLGIGLYISNEIITQHQGRMWVESTEGAGTTVTFCLPLHRNPFPIIV